MVYQRIANINLIESTSNSKRFNEVKASINNESEINLLGTLLTRIMRRVGEFSIYNIFFTDKSSFVKPVTSNMVAKEAIVSSRRGMKIHADKYKHTFTVNRVSGLASCLFLASLHEHPTDYKEIKSVGNVTRVRNALDFIRLRAWRKRSFLTESREKLRGREIESREINPWNSNLRFWILNLLSYPERGVNFCAILYI